MSVPHHLKKHCSVEQKNLLLNFIKEHPQMVTGKFSATFTHAKYKTLWVDLANILNAAGGANKDWQHWRKTWQDMKSRGKSSLAANRKSANKTGGGPPCQIEIDQLLLSTIGKSSVEGHSDLQPQVEFNYGDDNMGTASTSVLADISNTYLNQESIVTEEPVTLGGTEEEETLEPIQDQDGLIFEPTHDQERPILDSRQDQEENFFDAPLGSASTSRRGRKNIIESVAKDDIVLRKWYYEKKIKLMAEKNAHLKSIADSLSAIARK